MRAKCWKVQRESGSTSWHGQLSLDRFQVGYHVFRHEHNDREYRWVFQPFLIFDWRVFKA